MMLSQWEYLLTHRLLKRAAVTWHGLKPLPTWDIFNAQLPDLTVAANIPRTFDATVENWVEPALETADDLARMSGARLLLPDDPKSSMIDWIHPLEKPQYYRRMWTFVNVPLPKPGEWIPLAAAFPTVQAILSQPEEVTRDWIQQLEHNLPANSELLKLQILENILHGEGGATMNAPLMSERGIKPSLTNETSPVIHAEVERDFAPVVTHELGHASIPTFKVETGAGEERWLNPELTNMATLHRIMPILVNNLRQRLGESPYTAAAVGQMLSILLANHEAYLKHLNNNSAIRRQLVPHQVGEEHVRYAMSRLAGLNKLTDPWGQAVLAHALAHLTGNRPEDPRISRLRANVQNLIAYLAASVYSPQIPAGQLDFADFLKNLSKMVSFLEQHPDAEKSSRRARLYRTAIEGPRSRGQLRQFLKDVKDYVPDLAESIPYRTLYHILHRPKTETILLQKTMQYPKLTEPVTFK